MTPLLATLLLSTAPAPAPAPAAIEIDKSLVPAATPFLVHVDLRALLQGALAKNALAQMHDELDSDLEEVRSELGLDPMKDVYSATLFSATGSDKAGCVLLRTSAAIDGALERLKQREEYQRVERDGTTLDSIEGEVFFKVGRAGEDRIVIASNDAAEVLAAVAVVRGSAQSLADDPSSRLRAQPRQGAYVYVEVVEALERLTGHLPSSELAGLAKHLVLQVGERPGAVFVEAQVDTDDGEAAQNIGNVLNGLLSLVRLGVAHEVDVPPAALALLDEIDVQVAGTAVTLSMELDAMTLVKLLQEEGGF